MIKEIWQKDKSVCICKEFGLEKEITATQKLSGHVTHTHTHTLSVGGEGTFIFFFLAGLCATGAKAKGEERTREGTRSSSLHSGFFWKGNNNNPLVLPRIL